MSKKSNAAQSPKAEPKKARALEDGQYRALVAFAYKLDRVERGSVLTLTAEQAAELGDLVEFLPPPVETKVSEESTASDAGAANDQGQGAAPAGDGASAPTAPVAPVEGATGEANQDQVV